MVRIPPDSDNIGSSVTLVFLMLAIPDIILDAILDATLVATLSRIESEKK